MTMMSVLLAAGTSSVSADESTLGPGLAGFIAVFAVAVATLVLVRSMVGHLRKVRYSPEPPDPTKPEEHEPEASAGQN